MCALTIIVFQILVVIIRFVFRLPSHLILFFETSPGIRKPGLKQTKFMKYETFVALSTAA